MVGLALISTPIYAAEPGCTQTRVDGTTPPATIFEILPRHVIKPFYQWENNDGYCGEVSMMEAGLDNGQYMSQFNARLICGTGLSQSGPNGACAAHQNVPNYNAQLLIEDPKTGVTGPNAYASAAMCVANSRLAGSTFPYSTQSAGLAGFQQYMSWVKQQVIAGNQVTLAVLYNGGSDPQYDHEVGVIKIGTNHAVTDPSYYPDDVIYFDDHGAYTLAGNKFTSNPAIPPGAGSNITECTPYVFGYSFASLANSRAGANARGAQAYSVIIPQNRTIPAYTGGNGYDSFPITGPHNYGFSVSGPADSGHETLPVQLSILGPTYTAGAPNPRDAIAGYDYENPMIGKNVWAQGCTNTRPLPWMTHVVLQARVSGLTPDQGYNLYEYDFDGVKGVGASAALAVPQANFNQNAAMASHVTSFTATGTEFSTSVVTSSDKIVVFRAVPANGP